MRWSAQQVLDDGVGGEPTLPGLHGLLRSVRTPEFAGIVFHEVEARSALNRVPGSSPVPFRWTVNPYRGCSHACTYCLSGGAEVLLADGRTRPIADLRVGDAIYGTELTGRHRRYVRTEVLAHWRTVRRAHRVSLHDGTELITSGDHRFLTAQGWAHVTAGRFGSGPRPHLAPGGSLLGPGQLGTAPGGGERTRPVAGRAARAQVLDALPATAARPIEGDTVGTEAGLTVAAVEDLGVELPMYDITTGTGDFVAEGVVSHNCFARNTHTYLDLDPGADFDSQIVVKVNVARVLERELRSVRWAREPVAMGTNTDPYQRAEGRYRLMPGVIGALARSGTPFSLLTKGTLLGRDLPEITAAAADVPVALGVSIALLDRGVQAALEPGTPSPEARLDLVRRLTDAGLPCGVMVAPVLPLLTDSAEALDALLARIAAAGATGASVLALHLRRGTREWFLAWLAREHPRLVEPYARLYRRGAYVDPEYRRALGERAAPLLRRHGLTSAVPSLRGQVAQDAGATPQVPSGEQLSLL